ncbi:MAG: DUF2284 domain-containing protein [Clostridiales bacterium]|nr:DUF2284 domain-containing protein [Clostridiales bacterium]
MELETLTLTAEVPMEDFIRDHVDTERFLACCKECPGFGRTWACPPYDFDTADIWRSYGTVLLYAKKVILPDSETERTYSGEELSKAYRELLHPVKEELMSELLGMEKENEGSLALFAGGCDLCSECARAYGLPCRNTERMRYSVESLGGNVLKCLTDIFKEEILWAQDGRLPKHYLLLGALLKKE